MYIIDLETTGFSSYPYDLPLEVSLGLVDFTRKEVSLVYDSFISYEPSLREKINSCYWVQQMGGANYDVLCSQGRPIKEVFQEIFSILDGQYVTAWNTTFDLRIISGIQSYFNIEERYRPWKCPMKRSAKVMQLPSYRVNRYGGFTKVRNKFPKLVEAANFYGVDLSGGVYHQSSYDVIVTGHVLLKMVERGHYQLPVE